ncbi:hypothetical protein JRQ81_013730 [Phrynocephalus forsythii]|uniref:Regulator of cell cycle RGCC n=1 Tax=Phrynocephalus forsythii TaxID=171643 RepID=A0A9Q1B588_9SAUR|nr:hypothetical protein JRQ81_013730 [Phrynocephalus forsythii]
MEMGATDGAALSTDYLDDFLVEFDQVLQDFENGQVLQYEQYLDELKRKTSASMYDSGIDDSESNGASLGSSLNTSEEDLNTPPPAMVSCSKAKLGDTQALEEFIADLDRVLEEM